jgi:hypothetical protein
MTEINPQTPIPQEFSKEAIDAACKYDFTAERFLTSKGMGFIAGAEWAYRHLSPSAAPSAGTFFFSQDDSCHWYMIPTERREEWSKAGDLDLETDEGYEEWQKGNWEDYRTGGGIGDIDFIPSPPTPGA